MRQHLSVFPVTAAMTVAFTMVATGLLVPNRVNATETNASGPAQKLASPKIVTSKSNSAKSPPKSSPAGSPSSEPKPGEASCSCPQHEREKLWVRLKFADLSVTPQTIVLDESDEVAALESVQFALAEVGDGASYIWHRNNGHLSGMVQPVASFKDPQGQVCRHVVVILTSGLVSKKAEGVACRLSSGQWKLEG